VDAPPRLNFFQENHMIRPSPQISQGFHHAYLQAALIWRFAADGSEKKLENPHRSFQKLMKAGESPQIAPKET
jgi:hypothetical protein